MSTKEQRISLEKQTYNSGPYLLQQFLFPFRVAIIRDGEHRSVSEVASFTTPGCEPDPPLAPTLISRTKNSLNLQWKVSILLGKESQCVS